MEPTPAPAPACYGRGALDPGADAHRSARAWHDDAAPSVSACTKGVLLLCGLILSATAVAEEQHPQTRCQVTGPLVISAYTAFLKEVAKRDRFPAARQAQNVASLITLYERIGCPLPALQGAIECLTAKLVGTGSAPSPETARDAETCMREAGMPVR